MNKVELLAHRCNIVMLLLIDLYEKSEITMEEFKENTLLKVTFLKDHINQINHNEIKNISKDILTYYDKISTDNSNEFACNTQV